MTTYDLIGCDAVAHTLESPQHQEGGMRINTLAQIVSVALVIVGMLGV